MVFLQIILFDFEMSAGFLNQLLDKNSFGEVFGSELDRRRKDGIGVETLNRKYSAWM